MAKKPAAKKVAPLKAADPKDLTAKKFIARMMTFQSDAELRKIQGYFKSGEGQYAHGDKFVGVRMGQVFALAKAFVDMSPAEIEKLMEFDIHEARACAMSIMGQQAMLRKTTEARRKELYDLYLRRHDRIDNGPRRSRRQTRHGQYLATSRARSCASWRNPGTCGSAARRSTPASGAS